MHGNIHVIECLRDKVRPATALRWGMAVVGSEISRDHTSRTVTWALLAVASCGQMVAAYNSGLAIVVAPRLSVLSMQRRQREVRDELRSLGEAARCKPPGKKAHDVRFV